jgi:type III secretion protein T
VNPLWTLVSSDVLSLLLITARLVPMTLLCPLFGGMAASSSVRLTLVLSLATSLHWAGGLTIAAGSFDGWSLASVFLRELLLGLSMGLVASLPFDTARMGGRLLDTVRGASAEASLPWVGSREAASGDFLHQLLLAFAGVLAMPMIVSVLWRSFRILPLGLFVPGGSWAFVMVTAVATAFATGLAIAAPWVAGSLGVDLVLGLMARAAPGLRMGDVGAPVKLLGGAALLWLTLGNLLTRLMGEVDGLAPAMAQLLQGAAP